MNRQPEYENIPREAFEFVERSGAIHDQKFETKPIGYFKDAWIRFRRNQSSVIAACIIMVLVLYAIFVPIFCETNYSRSLTDTDYLNYTKLPPKIEWLGIKGQSNNTLNATTYLSYKAMGIETGMDPIVAVYRENYEDPTASKNARYYDVCIDEYYRMGMTYLTLTYAQFEDIQAWQDEHGIEVIFPAIKDSKQTDANIWYEANKKGAPTLDKEGNLKPIYEITTPEDTTYHSLRIAADNDPEKPMAYARVTGTSTAKSYVVRVSKYNYFQYRYGFEPTFVFGTNARGQDIFTRLASGARFSFLLAISISAINLFIGAMYGSTAGYYGGAVDMFMERVTDVLSGIPFIVVTSLFQMHLARKVGPVMSLVFAFILTGWIGVAGTVRMQFYRFKGQEYILAARTLGAKDSRLMFKHIFPNSLGTLITSSVLAIPGVIFSESSLTYLGIINLDSSTMTSVGTMLANGKDYLATYPHIIFFPALFISLLEISFNLFGNGLRDAFNPSLRGVE
ncbi:MAG: ABC transporter permease [Clostridia bacterium]|nr:ABC transporter permease [Clostridia bacterium]